MLVIRREKIVNELIKNRFLNTVSVIILFYENLENLFRKCQKTYKLPFLGKPVVSPTG